jgi:hypothetical protein
MGAGGAGGAPPAALTLQVIHEYTLQRLYLHALLLNVVLVHGCETRVITPEPFSWRREPAGYSQQEISETWIACSPRVPRVVGAAERSGETAAACFLVFVSCYVYL